MPKPARPRRDNSLATPSVGPSIRLTMTSDLSDRDVARRAFELYCDRGCQDGRDVDHWLTAERELRDSRSFSPLRNAKK